MKVQIENAVLRGLNQDWVPQRVASVFSDGKEYVIHAPARAKGDALDWVEHFEVREMGESRQGHSPVDERRSASIIKEVKEQLEKQKQRSEIWSWGNNNASYYAGQICLKGHVQSSDGKHEVPKGENCPQCGNPIIDACPHCEAPIRGHDIYLHREYVRPSFCYKCARPYPWMEDRLQTAKELLYQDEKLSLEERDKLWGLLQHVMSDPRSDLAPAKKKLIEIGLAKAAAATRDVVLGFLAKYAAEMSKG